MVKMYLRRGLCSTDSPESTFALREFPLRQAAWAEHPHEKYSALLRRAERAPVDRKWRGFCSSHRTSPACVPNDRRVGRSFLHDRRRRTKSCPLTGSFPGDEQRRAPTADPTLAGSCSTRGVYPDAPPEKFHSLHNSSTDDGE